MAQPPKSAKTPAKARAPSQARGVARIEAILDAAAALLIEKGPAGLTMHGVARRAGAPVGSMYHFFPDRDNLVEALRDRHKAALDEVEERINRIDARTWRSFTPEEVMAHIMQPHIAYFEQHPDCLILTSAFPEPVKEKGTSPTLRKVIEARLGHVSGADRALYIDMIDALAVGALAYRLRPALGNVPMASRYLTEVQRALAAYLSAIEASTKSSSRS
jgi:AcrR family transcriptional regulator